MLESVSFFVLTVYSMFEKKRDFAAPFKSSRKFYLYFFLVFFHFKLLYFIFQKPNKISNKMLRNVAAVLGVNVLYT